MRTTTLILGGGFGGLAAANTLRELLSSDHEIVVVDQGRDFQVGAGKIWLMLGARRYAEMARPRADVLADGVRSIQTTVRSLDFARHTVATDQGTLGWTYLIIALGANLNLASVPGLADAAHTFYTVEGAQRLKGALDAFTGGAVVLLIPRVPFKCPPAPYEAAILLHHAFADRGLADKTRLAIYTTEGAPMATAGPEMGQYIRDELAQRGIGFHPQRTVRHVDGAARHVAFADGTTVPYDLLIAVPPHEAPAVVREGHLTDPSGWIPVEPRTLQVTSVAGADGVYAIGDVTTLPLPGRYAPEKPLVLPKAGVFAEAQGRVVAHQVAAKIRGATPTETFTGEGYCYLEVGGGRAVKADGAFFAVPHPVMQRRAPDEEQFRDKLAWVARQVRPIR